MNASYRVILNRSKRMICTAETLSSQRFLKIFSACSER